MKYINTLSYFIVLAFLSGCSSSTKTTDPLQQQLEGKSPHEQREVLRLACLNGAEKITGRSSLWKHSTAHGTIYIHDKAVEQMKTVCRQMDSEYLTESADKKLSLYAQCNAQLDKINNPKSVQAVNDMRDICDVYTQGRSKP